MLQQIYHEKAY